MNFNQLKYIVSVNRHRSFSRAADECEIAQSTLSKEIQRLEKEFGIMIFDRSRFPVTPTMKGDDLIHQAEKILEEQKLFIEIARKMDNRPEGNFRLGILPLLAPYLLPLFVSSLSRKYPKLCIEMEELSSREMVTLFEDGQLDCAITFSPFVKNGFYEEPVFAEHFALYVNQHHPLSAPEVVKWNDIPMDELLIQDELRNYLLPAENKTGSSYSDRDFRNINYHNGSVETIRKIIDRNGGLTLLPGLARLYMGERRLKMVRPIVQPELTRMVVLVTPRGFEKNRIIKVIKKEIVDNLPHPFPQ